MAVEQVVAVAGDLNQLVLLELPEVVQFMERVYLFQAYV